MKLKDLIERSSIREPLIRAVVSQIGGWEEFKECAQDVCEHGAAGGFSGFIYYRETVDFYLKNAQVIKEMCHEYSRDFGIGTLEMIGNFGCIRGDFTVDELGEAFYTTKYDSKYDLIYNALAWFALEEVCRAYEMEA